MTALSEGTWQIYNERNDPDRYFVTLTPENVTDANEYYNIMQRNNSNDIWKFGDRYDDTNNANLGLTEATIGFTRGVNNSITEMTVTPGYNGDGMFDEYGRLRLGGRKRSKKVKRSKKRATRRRRSSKNKSRKMNRRKRY